MSDTRDKLQEARYFLERMKACYRTTEDFRYNLSAFLTALRSITDLMNVEYQSRPGFKDWHDTLLGRLKFDKRMGVLREKRRIAVHLRPVRPHASLTTSDTLTIGESVSIRLSESNGSVVERYASSVPSRPDTTEGSAASALRWFFTDLHGEDVITVCEYGLRKLESAVSECESLFLKRTREPARLSESERQKEASPKT